MKTPTRRAIAVVLAVLLLVSACSTTTTEDDPWVTQVLDVLHGLFVGNRSDDAAEEPAPDLEPGKVTVSGTPLPVLVDGLTDPAVGMPAPEIHGFDFAGNPVVVSNDGSSKAILFLAHWCPHCQEEVPRVQEWLDGGGGVGDVEIVSVATSINPNLPNFPPEDWLEREGWEPLVIVDVEDRVFNAYGGSGFPFWVFVDGGGRVVRRSAGELDIPLLEAYLGELRAN